MWTQWNVKKRLCSSEIYDFMMRVRQEISSHDSNDGKRFFVFYLLQKLKISLSVLVLRSVLTWKKFYFLERGKTDDDAAVTLMNRQ